jgi:hypothetical protein
MTVVRANRFAVRALGGTGSASVRFPLWKTLAKPVASCVLQVIRTVSALARGEYLV